jgi:outer membrane protein assembly factor BamB
MMRPPCGLTLLGLIMLLSGARAETQVVTRSYDNGRTGADLTETLLTPQLVASKGLKRSKSLIIDDDPRIEAQPLYVPNLAMSDGKTHNVIFVASMGNHVFAFDADAPQGHDLLWKTSLGEPFNPPEVQEPPTAHRKTTIDLFGINILWGILSTPVIDIDTKTMYCVNWVVQDGKPALFLHRLRLEDGQETSQPPEGLRLEATQTHSDGTQVFDAHGDPLKLKPDQKVRAALLLTPLSGQHKILFAATNGGEAPGDPHGWVLAFDTDSFTQTAAWVATKHGFGGGIWHGAAGPAADAAGNFYAMTGNGGFDVKNGKIEDFIGGDDFAEAFVKLSYRRTGLGKGSLDLVDWLIPFRDADRHSVNDYDYKDQDLSSAGPVLPPGTDLLFGAGKDGILYVLNRDNLGKKVGIATPNSTLPNNAKEVDGVLKAPPLYVTYNGLNLPTSVPNIDFPLGSPTKTHHLHGSPVYWDGAAGPMLFVWGENESLRSWKVDPTLGTVSFVAKGAEVASAELAAQPEGIGGMPGAMLAVSSNGKMPHTGIVWATAPENGDANQDVVTGIARAYDATDLDPTPIDPNTPQLKLIWDSNRAGVTFNYSKFCPPVVANGQVLVPTYDGRVDIYVPSP